MRSRRSNESLDTLERSAWREYLTTTREAEPGRYAEVESWAWQRLSQRRKAIEKQRSRLAA